MDSKELLKKAFLAGAVGFTLMNAGDLTPNSWKAFADDDQEKSDHKCGEGECGEDMKKKKTAEHKCGEGSCGDDKKGKESSCGEGSCG